MSEREERLALLALNLLERVGPVRVRALVERFGSAAAALAAPSRAWTELPGFGARLASVKEELNLEAAEEEWREAEENGIRLVFWDEEDYPALLKEIANPPPVLYVKGRLDPERDRRSVAMVGSRKASEYGIEMARGLSRHLAQAGLTVVSGLAMGVDCAAHEGALEGQGRTVAVLGSGLLARGYDVMRSRLMETIVERDGAVVSEFPLRFPAAEWSYPRRNRIISGWSLGTVVAEAAAKSGALGTAAHAMEQGREVFAIPHRITAIGGRGANRLIRDGARIVMDAEDILEELAPAAGGFLLRTLSPTDDERLVGLSEDARLLYNELTADPVHPDDLARRVNLPVGRIGALVLELELEGLARQRSGRVFRPMG